MGYILNGFYMVKPAGVNIDNAKLETVFCAFEQPEDIAFNSSTVEKRIVHLNHDNIKSTSGIHLHVQGNVSNLNAGKSISKRSFKYGGSFRWHERYFHGSEIRCVPVYIYAQNV